MIFWAEVKTSNQYKIKDKLNKNLYQAPHELFLGNSKLVTQSLSISGIFNNENSCLIRQAIF
jgi:hypothetical protein